MNAASVDADGERLLETTISSSCREEEEARRCSAGAAGSGGIHDDDDASNAVPNVLVTTTTGADPSWYSAVARRTWSAGPLLMLMSALCFSLMDVCAKGAERRLPALQAVAARVAFMLPFNTLVLWRNGIHCLGHPDTRALLIQRGVCGFFAFGCLLQAVQWLPVGDAVVIFYTYPVVTCAMAAVVLGDKFTALDLAAGVTAAAGVVLVVQPPFMGFPSKYDHDQGGRGRGGGDAGGGGALPTRASYGAGVAAALLAALMGGVAICTVRVIGPREHALTLLQWFGVRTSVPFHSNPFQCISIYSNLLHCIMCVQPLSKAPSLVCFYLSPPLCSSAHVCVSLEPFIFSRGASTVDVQGMKLYMHARIEWNGTESCGEYNRTATPAPGSRCVACRCFSLPSGRWG